MNEPKLSEIMYAAARGYMEPFSTQQPQSQGMGGHVVIGRMFDSADYSRAQSMASAFRAIGDVYAKVGL